MAKKQFKAESKRLLDLMINSIYTNREIFLRELISNASDAIDKLAYLALTDESVGLSRGDFAIHLSADKAQRTLTIRDNGIGMSKDEMEENLGTIAHSGSLDFKKEMEKREDIDIIGQFGVGFYSAFMVADTVRVRSKKFGADEAWCWESAGADGYTMKPCEAESCGTEIVLTLKEDSMEYLEQHRLRALIRKYSDYIRYPIRMEVSEQRPIDGAKEDEPKFETVTEEQTLNSMIPVWQKNKKDVTQEEYDSFYTEKFYDYEKPLSTLHISVEGAVTYMALLYIPAKAPYDFYTKDAKTGLQLYSSGVLIMDNCAELLPEHFRFVRGVVDTQDISLNISREMLQQTRELKTICTNLEKKIKAELLRLLESERENYEKFYAAFGRQLKYGVVSDYGMHKELLQDLLQFHSDREGKLVTLKEYCAAMPESQKPIYYVSGENAARLPQTVTLRARGFDVLLFKEQVDEFIPQTLGSYEAHDFRNILTDDLELTTQEEKQAAQEKAAEFKDCLAFIQEALGEKVKEVRVSTELGRFPVSMVPDGGMSFEMEKYFKAVDPNADFKSGRVLEINPEHALLQKLQSAMEEDPARAKKYADLLYSQGLLMANLPLEDPTEYTALVCELIQ
ncbi:MAG: molecular chaperone HtpG [Oscillospiraceae bacterium]|jgi:molecular chaperone HtpG|nr:molecular chaperone HtpG [Oscillospiraceae bacterium]